MSVLPHDRLQRHIAETTRQTSAVLPLPKYIVLRIILSPYLAHLFYACKTQYGVGYHWVRLDRRALLEIDRSRLRYQA